MNDITYPDFTGKTLSITIIEDEGNFDITDPYFEMQAGRLFLIGTVPPKSTNSGWTVNKKFAIAWERVERYVVFDSVSDFKKAVQISDDHEESKKFENDF